MLENEHDIEEILSLQHVNGFKLWTTSDKKLLKGGPYTTLESPLYLKDLGLPITDSIYADVAELIFSTWREDGRFKISPTGGIYPCHVALALRTLCYLGFSQDKRLIKTLNYFINTQEIDGGWKCNKYSFGRGEETFYSTPHTTLIILDCMRFFNFSDKEKITTKASEFLLHHWTTKKPISPCHYGIGTLFMQLEYPFRGYNLFYYVYVLSFYRNIVGDSRFLEAYNVLESKAENNGIIIERVVPKLSKLISYKKGEYSILATKKYYEIKERICSVT